MPNVPYIGFGSDELEKMAPVGETATCPGCGQSHTVEYGDEVKKDGTKVPSKLLGFVKCGETLYLVALGGKALHIEKNKPSVSGSIPLEEKTLRHLRRPLSAFVRCGLPAAECRTTGAGPLCQECRRLKRAWKPQPPIIERASGAFCIDYRKATSVRDWIEKAVRP